MSDDLEEAQPIRRRAAQSDRVSFSDPVVLHESSRTRVIFVPFFITRTEGTELAMKIQTYKKQVPPFQWVLVDDKSVSLQEPAARALLAALRSHLAVADQAPSDGSYIVIPVESGVANLGRHEPAAVADALARVLGQPDIVKHLADANLGDQLIGAMRGAIRLRELQSAVSQLRAHLENGVADEQTFQKWCEANSWAFGNAYVMRDGTREIAPGDNLDMLLPTVIAGYRDIVELKRPDVEVMHLDAGHRNYYFSAETSRAIGQCHRYLDVLHEVARNGLRDHPEIVAYHPRATIVIGRSREWSEEKLRSLHGLNARLAGLTVMTYDHLLNQGERLVHILTETVASVEQPGDPFAVWDAPEEEPPPF